MEKIGVVAAIKRYFEQPSNDTRYPERKLSMDELKALTLDDRKELAQACAAALGCELEVK